MVVFGSICRHFVKRIIKANKQICVGGRKNDHGKIRSLVCLKK